MSNNPDNNQGGSTKTIAYDHTTIAKKDKNDCISSGYQHYYRPQTKFAKVMFLHLSVILFTGGRAWWGDGGHVWQGVCGACVVGGCGRYHEIRSMSGQYASYWNAFLLNKLHISYFSMFLKYASFLNSSFHTTSVFLSIKSSFSKTFENLLKECMSALFKVHTNLICNTIKTNY